MHRRHLEVLTRKFRHSIAKAKIRHSIAIWQSYASEDIDYYNNEKKWWPNLELNQGHADFQSAALPTELFGHI